MVFFHDSLSLFEIFLVRKTGVENYIRCSYILPDGLHHKRGVVKNPDLVPMAYRHLSPSRSGHTQLAQDNLPTTKEEKPAAADTQACETLFKIVCGIYLIPLK